MQAPIPFVDGVQGVVTSTIRHSRTGQNWSISPAWYDRRRLAIQSIWRQLCDWASRANRLSFHRKIQTSIRTMPRLFIRFEHVRGHYAVCVRKARAEGRQDHEGGSTRVGDVASVTLIKGEVMARFFIDAQASGAIYRRVLALNGRIGPSAAGRAFAVHSERQGERTPIPVDARNRGAWRIHCSTAPATLVF